MLGGLIAAVLAQATGSAAIGGGQADVLPVTTPYWINKPSGEDIARAYPRAATQNALDGFATFTCQVDAAGRLENCSVVSEGPVDGGFGQASLRLTKLFKMGPTDKSGAAVQGRTIRIPVRFMLPAGTLKEITLTDPGFVDSDVTIDCRASPPTTVDNCMLVAEQPAGAGAGKMGMDIGPKLKVQATRPLRFRVKIVLKNGPPSPAPAS